MSSILHFTTDHIECGIREYTNFLMESLPHHDHRLVPASENYFFAYEGEKPNIVHIQWAGGVYDIQNLLLTLHEARRDKVPVIVTYHNDAYGAASFNPDRIFIHNEQDRDKFKGYPTHQIAYIPHGIPNYFSLEPSEPMTFAVMGFLLPHKGVAQIVDVFSDFSQIHSRIPTRLILSCPLHPPNMRFSQSLEVQIRRKIQEYPDSNIELHTDFVPMEQLIKRLRPASVFLYPYLNQADQASSAAITTAIGMVRPAIISDLPIFGSINQGVIKIPPGDFGSLKKAMAAIQDPETYSRLFMEMRLLAESRSWSRVGMETDQVYKSLLSPNKPVDLQRATNKWKNRVKVDSVPKNILVVGNHEVPVSFSHVLVEMTKPLIRKNLANICYKNISSVCIRGVEHFTTTFEDKNTYAEFRYQYPPDTNFPNDGRKKLIMASCEGTYAPPSWVSTMRNVDKLLTPSEFSRQAFIKAGIPEKKIIKAPHGVDHSIFHPNEENHYDWSKLTAYDSETIIFFAMAAFDMRKGYDILLNSYFQTFTGEDNVVLALKNNSFQSCYPPIQNLYQQYKNHPRVALIQAELPGEMLAAMYRSATVGVFPYRGEGGFGLIPLEMMACGTPCILSNFGAPMEYANEETSWLIPGEEIPMDHPNRFYDNDSRSNWFSPDSEALGNIMRGIYQDQSEVPVRGSESQQRASSYTWDKPADILMEIVG
jgi:glycosyltransferase involved in cell wall biosynthesis